MNRNEMNKQLLIIKNANNTSISDDFGGIGFEGMQWENLTDILTDPYSYQYFKPNQTNQGTNEHAKMQIKSGCQVKVVQFTLSFCIKMGGYLESYSEVQLGIRR